MSDYVSVQPSDAADAASVGSVSAHPNVADYVRSGLDIDNPDFADGTFDLSAGEAFWLVDEAEATTEGTTRYGVLLTAHYDARQGRSFDPDATNHVWARCNGVWPGTPDDAPKIDVTQSESDDPDPPSDDSIRIAVIDGPENAVYPDNQNPDGVFAALEADDVVIRESLEAEGLVDTTALADGAVTNPKVGDGEIDGRTIADGEVGHEEIGHGEVRTDELKYESVTTDTMADAAVVAGKLAALSVHNDALQSGAVTTPKIANGAITRSKIGDGAVDTNQLRGRAVTPSVLDANKRYRMQGLYLGDSILLRGGGPPHESPGTANNEVLRTSGAQSDLVWQIQGGGGRSTMAWNAKYDNDDDEWYFIEGGEPAMAFRMHGGSIGFWTCDAEDNPGAGEPVSWERATIDNGGISNAHNLGGVAANDYLRKRNVVDIRGGELTLLNHDAARSNTSHDLVFENQPSGDRLHMNFRREDFRIFEEGRFHDPITTFYRNGHIEPSEGLMLPGGGHRGRPRQGVAAKLYYYNNELWAVNDADQRTILGSF